VSAQPISLQQLHERLSGVEAALGVVPDWEARLKALRLRVIHLENALPEDQVTANSSLLNSSGEVETPVTPSAGSITSAMLSAGLKNVLLLAEPKAGERESERAANTNFTPSASQATLVILTITSKAAEALTTVVIEMAEEAIATIKLGKQAEAETESLALVVAAGVTWRYKVTGGAIGNVKSTYIK
jgi:hypothetical protein